MKRIEALKEMISDKMLIQIVIGGLTFDAQEVIKAYDYLDGDIREKKTEVEEVQEPKKEIRVVKGSSPKPKKKLDDGKMVALRKAGWNYSKIADEMGCSVQTVINHIKRKIG